MYVQQTLEWYFFTPNKKIVERDFAWFYPNHFFFFFIFYFVFKIILDMHTMFANRFSKVLLHISQLRVVMVSTDYSLYWFDVRFVATDSGSL